MQVQNSGKYVMKMFVIWVQQELEIYIASFLDEGVPIMEPDNFTEIINQYNFTVT
jgi:hypothetical protein